MRHGEFRRIQIFGHQCCQLVVVKLIRDMQQFRADGLFTQIQLADDPGIRHGTVTVDRLTHIPDHHRGIPDGWIKRSISHRQCRYRS